jgi:Ig-like domain-containing protein
MKPKYRIMTYWPGKVLICAAFFGFWTSKCLAQLGGPPTIVVQPLGVAVQNGGTAILTATALSPLLTPTFTWTVNGKSINHGTVANVAVPLVGTVTTLTIPNVSGGDRGDYKVKVSNASGSTISQPATLLIVEDTVSNVVGIVTGSLGMTTNGFHLQLLKPVNSNCVVDASTDLQNWTPVYTNSTSSTNISYLDNAATNLSFRYYRMRLQ